MPFKSLHAERSSGFTLLETATAVGFLGLFISILMVTSSNVLGLLRTARDNVSASQTIQERIETLRTANWLQVTNPTYVANNYLAANSQSAAGLAGVVETITISPYPEKPGFTPATIVRKNNVTTVVSTNPLLSEQRMVRVDVALNWTGFPNKRSRERMTSALIAKGGTAK